MHCPACKTSLAPICSKAVSPYTKTFSYEVAYVGLQE